MAYETRLCFDECLPRKWCMRLADMLEHRKQPVECFHLVDRYKSGADDCEVADWLAAHNPPVLMLSGDSAAKSKRDDPRLPLILPARGITSIFIARKLCQREGFEKTRMIMYCMPQILRAYEQGNGIRYRLKMSGADSYQIKEWPLPASHK